MVTRSQVVQIRAGGFVGTGFLIAPDKVATALHVVVQLDEREQPIIESGEPVPLDPIECIYYSPAERRYWSEPINFVPDRDPHDKDDDWVVLSVAKAPADAVWQCRPLGLDNRRECRGYGFPGHDDMGTPLDGKVTGVREPAPIDGRDPIEVHLICIDQALGPAPLNPRGTSGGPVVVDGRAIGLVRSFVPGSDDSQSQLQRVVLAGTFWVTPIECVLRGLAMLGAEVELPPLPDAATLVTQFRKTPALYQALKGRDRVSSEQLADVLVNAKSVLDVVSRFADAMLIVRQDNLGMAVANQMVQLFQQVVPPLAARCPVLVDVPRDHRNLMALHPQTAEPNLAAEFGRAIEFGEEVDDENLLLPKRYITCERDKIPEPGLDLDDAIAETRLDMLRRNEGLLEHVAREVGVPARGSLDNLLSTLTAKFKRDPEIRGTYTMVSYTGEPLELVYIQLLREIGLRVLVPRADLDDDTKQVSYELRQALHSFFDIYRSILRGQHGST
jgi:hypothetical protein